MLKLHFVPNSRAGRIYWLLKEMDMPFELNRMDFHPSALKSDEHRERHPLGRVPVLEDGDVTIFETGAIMEYVMARYGDKGFKPAVDSPDFPAYLQWFHYSEGMVMPPINIIVVNTLLLPHERQDQNALNQAKKLLGKALAPIDEALEGREYLAGDFSAADIQLGHACIMSGRLGMIDDSMPNLAAYVERLQQRPACQEAFAA